MGTSPRDFCLVSANGGEGGFAESVRKGLAQTLGRYTTNIKEPVGYAMPALKLAKIFDYAKAVATDDPRHTWAKGFPGFDPLADDHAVGARAVLYREMFDLDPYPKSRHSGMVKTGEKEYELKARP